MMNVALVHELLTMKGGAERMLRILAAMYPNAPIYTLLYDEKKLGDWFPRERIRTSTLQKWSLPLPNFQFSIRPRAHGREAIFNFQFRYNHHLYLPFSPKAVESWDFSDFDLVISSSSAFAHGIITNGKPRHLCYVHSPARYLWDRTHEIMERPAFAKATAGKFAPLRLLRKFYLSHLFHALRIWDAESADRPDMLLAASKSVQRRIELYWRRESTVLYPPLDDHWLDQAMSYERLAMSPSQNSQLTAHSYYLVVSTLAPYKRIELAIEACNQLHLPLKIAGNGSDRKRLERLAGPTIEFLGYVSEGNLPDLYRNAIATIFPGDEDFGLVPLESMATGTPVIAYRGGGALETILEGKTGAFFDEPTPASLAKALQHFDRACFLEEACHAQAQTFSRERFEMGIRSTVESPPL